MLTVKLTKDEFLKAEKEYIEWLVSVDCSSSTKADFIRQLRLRYRKEKSNTGYILVNELWDFYILTETKLWKELYE